MSSADTVFVFVGTFIHFEIEVIPPQKKKQQQQKNTTNNKNLQVKTVISDNFVVLLDDVKLPLDQNLKKAYQRKPSQIMQAISLCASTIPYPIPSPVKHDP